MYLSVPLSCICLPSTSVKLFICPYCSLCSSTRLRYLFLCCCLYITTACPSATCQPVRIFPRLVCLALKLCDHLTAAVALVAVGTRLGCLTSGVASHSSSANPADVTHTPPATTTTTTNTTKRNAYNTSHTSYTTTNTTDSSNVTSLSHVMGASSNAAPTTEPQPDTSHTIYNTTSTHNADRINHSHAESIIAANEDTLRILGESFLLPSAHRIFPTESNRRLARAQDTFVRQVLQVCLLVFLFLFLLTCSDKYASSGALDTTPDYTTDKAYVQYSDI